VNNELERMWKEGDMTKYVVPFRYLPRGMDFEEPQKSPISQISNV